VIDPAEYPDVLVTIAHPAGDIEVPLDEWIRTGPGPRRYIEVIRARRTSGDPLSLDEIPQEFHNSPESRSLQRLGELPTPWGEPPPEL